MLFQNKRNSSYSLLVLCHKHLLWLCGFSLLFLSSVLMKVLYMKCLDLPVFSFMCNVCCVLFKKSFSHQDNPVVFPFTLRFLIDLYLIYLHMGTIFTWTLSCSPINWDIWHAQCVIYQVPFTPRSVFWTVLSFWLIILSIPMPVPYNLDYYDSIKCVINLLSFAAFPRMYKLFFHINFRITLSN